MKNFLLFVCISLISTSSFGQKMKFKVTGVPDTTVHLIKYIGKDLRYADTAQMKAGYVSFDGAKHEPGIMGLLLPGEKFFEFINNDEEIYMETDIKDFIGSMKVKKSDENKIFLDYINYLGAQKKLAGDYVNQRKPFKEGTPEYKELNDKINAVSKEVLAYQNKLIETNEDKLVSKIVKMSLDIEIPEAPKDENGKQIDSSFNYHYYFDHYFDNFDLTDDRLLNTPIFGNKFDQYFSKRLMIQHWDTVIKYAFQFCDQLDPKSNMFQYAVTKIIIKYQKSKIMGMDKVPLYMLDRYYCTRDAEGKSMAYWMTEDKLKSICEDMPGKKNTVLGIVPPNISLRDTSDNDQGWHDLYSLKAEYKILYFWAPDCGHCKKTTPKLERLYSQKLKARNVEVFGVCKALGKDFKLWKKFIIDSNITFTNVAVTESLYQAVKKDASPYIPRYTTYASLNYHQTMDVYATPRVYVLDKNNKIIAKHLTISQLEDFLDNMQGIENPVKLFPFDPEEEESMKD